MSREQRQPAPPRKPGKPLYFNHEELGMTQAAQSIERVDIYTNTMEGVRYQIVRIVEQAQN